MLTELKPLVLAVAKIPVVPNRDIALFVEAEIHALVIIHLAFIGAIEAPQGTLHFIGGIGHHRCETGGIHAQAMARQGCHAKVARTGTPEFHLVEIKVRSICEIQTMRHGFLHLLLDRFSANLCYRPSSKATNAFFQVLAIVVSDNRTNGAYDGELP